MKKTLIIATLYTFSSLLFFNKTNAQVSIVSAVTTVYNITPKGLLEVSVMNQQNDIRVIIEGKILNAQNEVILDVVSTPLTLKKGMNATAQLNLGVASTVYSNSQASNYIKTSHTLPSGKYTYCAFIKSFPNDIVTDEFCEPLEAEASTFLFLVSPPDKEEIETKYPILIWTHSEPFTNSAVDYYRILVTDLNVGQSPEAAVNTNIPIYMKNYLNSHNVLYPVDAKELQAGRKYAWQVQQMANGVIVNKTEAWEFKLKGPPVVKENKYATVKKTLDGTYYTAEGNKIFFRFDEGYGNKDVQYKILNEKQQVITTDKSKGEVIKMAAVKNGYNQFMIDLNDYKIGKGIYLLEVTNDKNEVFKLKFSAE